MIRGAELLDCVVGPGARIGERCKVQNQALVYEPAVLGEYLGARAGEPGDSDRWS